MSFWFFFKIQPLQRKRRGQVEALSSANLREELAIKEKLCLSDYNYRDIILELEAFKDYVYVEFKKIHLL